MMTILTHLKWFVLLITLIDLILLKLMRDKYRKV